MSIKTEENLRKKFSPAQLREYRKSHRESQFYFWSRFGITQSRGSRFEMGTTIPPVVAILLGLYFEGVITDNDLSKQPIGNPISRRFQSHLMIKK